MRADELEALVESINDLTDEDGIVVYVKAAKYKVQEVKSIMEQSEEIKLKYITTKTKGEIIYE